MWKVPLFFGFFNAIFLPAKCTRCLTPELWLSWSVVSAKTLGTRIPVVSARRPLFRQACKWAWSFSTNANPDFKVNLMRYAVVFCLEIENGIREYYCKNKMYKVNCCSWLHGTRSQLCRKVIFKRNLFRFFVFFRRHQNLNVFHACSSKSSTKDSYWALKTDHNLTAS